MTAEERIQVLRDTTRFADWSDDMVALLPGLVDEARVLAGTVVAEQGRQCHELVVVASGVLESCRSGSTDLVRRGEVLGWDAMRDRDAHQATVRAVTPAVLLVMSHVQFQAAMAIASEAGRSTPDSPDNAHIWRSRSAVGPDYRESAGLITFGR